MTQQHRFPRLAKAAWERRWEKDCTGDYPDQDFCAILRHDVELARCRCGKREIRHVVTDRMLVGGNAGVVRTTWLYDRPSCKHGSGSSNYRQPW